MHDQPPLLIERIRDALHQQRLVVPVIRISVAAVPKWEEMPGAGPALVRWICWNITDAGTEVTQPEFEILHPSITLETLQKELPAYFPEVTVMVDDDIDVSDDEAAIAD